MFLLRVRRKIYISVFLSLQMHSACDGNLRHYYEIDSLMELPDNKILPLQNFLLWQYSEIKQKLQMQKLRGKILRVDWIRSCFS